MQDELYGYVIICLLILSDCRQGGEEICKKISKSTVSSYILGEDVIENKWLKLCSTEVFVCWECFCFPPQRCPDF